LVTDREIECGGAGATPLYIDKLNALKGAFIEDCVVQAGRVGVRPVWLR
jgi:hypothetical protein